MKQGALSTLMIDNNQVLSFKNYLATRPAK
jgi:hypothetical protein